MSQLSPSIKSVLPGTLTLPTLLLSCGPAGPIPANPLATYPAATPSTPGVALVTAALQKPPLQVAGSYNIGGSAALNTGSTPTRTVISLDLYDGSKRP